MVTFQPQGDVAPQALSLQESCKHAEPDLAAIVLAIAGAAPALADMLAAGSLYGDPARVTGKNESGDPQKALDLAAHHHLLSTLADVPVRWVLSEEAAEPILLNADALYDVAMDPIDGSGSIGTGLPLGTIFSVLPATGRHFTSPGRSIVAAGYISYGHSTDMGFSVGDGVCLATLHRPTGAFHLVRSAVSIPPDGGLISYNAANERFWSPGLARWAEDLRLGATGPQGRDANMRWYAAAVGDAHRVLSKGGMFLYPADCREGYQSGRLRLIYEAMPIAYLVEQAGGLATDGTTAILDLIPRDLHGFTPLFFGACEEVQRLKRYLS
ncbi:MAG: class 1 fructose-bisphosphatase [Pseudomonadota bacterium]